MLIITFLVFGGESIDSIQHHKKHVSSCSFRYGIVTLLLLKIGILDRVSWKPILLL